MIVFVLYVFSLLLVQGIADYMLTAGERERERERERATGSSHFGSSVWLK